MASSVFGMMPAARVSTATTALFLPRNSHLVPLQLPINEGVFGAGTRVHRCSAGDNARPCQDGDVPQV